MSLRLINVNLVHKFKNLTKLCLCNQSQHKIHTVCVKKKFEIKLSSVYLYSSESPRKCWQCNFPYKSELFCQKCKTLQEPPESLDYFEILGVKKDYDVESKEIQKKYRALQNILHPDRFGNKTEKEKHYSEDLSSLINKAYATLTNPLDRGLYLLKLKNLSIPEGTTSLNPEFLMKIMEINEAVEEASTDKDKVRKLIDDNRKELELLSRQVSEAFHRNELDEAKRILVKMKYYASLDDRLKKIKQDLGIVD